MQSISESDDTLLLCLYKRNHLKELFFVNKTFCNYAICVHFIDYLFFINKFKSQYLIYLINIIHNSNI